MPFLNRFLKLRWDTYSEETILILLAIGVADLDVPEERRSNSLTKLKGSTFMTAWCLTAFVALGCYSAVGPAFASGRLAQTSIRKPSRKPTTVNSSASSVIVEEFSFLIKDFKIEHQGETNNLNISIQYRYRVNIPDSEYPDFRPVAKDIEMFLTNYPNEKDYWEILNKKITLLVLDKYPPITKVPTCQIVEPVGNRCLEYRL